jgi:hypothetical protein
VRVDDIGVTGVVRTLEGDYSPGNAGNADIAASAGNGKRQTPNAFLSPPTSGTLFDVLITDYRLLISKLNSGAGWRGQETAPRLPFPAIAAMSAFPAFPGE